MPKKTINKTKDIMDNNMKMFPLSNQTDKKNALNSAIIHVIVAKMGDFISFMF